MPRTRKRIPTAKLHRPSGQARLRIDGREIYLGRWESQQARQRYDEIIQAYLANGRRLPLEPRPVSSELTVTELWVRYWKEHVTVYYRKDGKPTSEQATIKAAIRPLRRMFGTLPADQLTPKRLKEYRQAMIRRWSLHCLNDQVSRVKRMFAWATEEELVPGTVYHALMAVKRFKPGRSGARELPPVQPVPDATVEATLPHLSPLVADLVRLQRLTGARSGELVSMRGADVDRGPDVWRYTPARHKTEHHGKRRVIFIGPQAQQILGPYLIKAGTGPLFIARNGKPIRRDSINQAVARACKMAQVETWHPHQLRHARATELREKFGLEESAAVLGHSDLKVTERYAQRSLEKAAAVMRTVG